MVRRDWGDTQCQGARGPWHPGQRRGLRAPPRLLRAPTSSTQPRNGPNWASCSPALCFGAAAEGGKGCQSLPLLSAVFSIAGSCSPTPVPWRSSHSVATEGPLLAHALGPEHVRLGGVIHCKCSLGEQMWVHGSTWEWGLPLGRDPRHPCLCRDTSFVLPELAKTQPCSHPGWSLLVAGRDRDGDGDRVVTHGGSRALPAPAQGLPLGPRRAGSRQSLCRSQV